MKKHKSLQVVDVAVEIMTMMKSARCFSYTQSIRKAKDNNNKNNSKVLAERTEMGLEANVGITK